MLTSGLTAIATTSDTAVDVIANSAAEVVSEVTIVNEGTVAGFWSIDGGATWGRLSASAATTINIRHKPIAAVVKVKRVASGTDLASIYAWAV